MKRPDLFFLSFFLIISLIGPYDSVAGAQQNQTYGPDDPHELEAFTDDFFLKQMNLLQIPGLAFVMVKDGHLFLEKGYGYADLKHKTPVLPAETAFRMASVSKLFTATAIMQLYEQRKLDLHADVNTYLKQFQLEAAFGQPVTLHHLLTHTAGLTDSWKNSAVQREDELLPVGQYLKSRVIKRSAPPGEVISYSNEGVDLMGHIIEEVSGQTFPDYMESHVLKPLGMKNSTFLQQAPAIGDVRQASGYTFWKGKHEPVSYDFYHGVPSGALTATAEDIARFMLAHLQKGHLDKDDILQAGTIETMHRQQFTQNPKMPGMAYGFFESFDNGRRALMHEGSLPEATSLLYLLPEENIGFFVVFNLNAYSESRPHQLSVQFVNAFMDRYFPNESLHDNTEPFSSVSNQAGSVSAVEGAYRPTWIAQHEEQKLLNLFYQLRVQAEDNHTIQIGKKRYFQEAPLLWQSEDGEALTGFAITANGQSSYMFWDAPAPVTKSWKRSPWYETYEVNLSIVVAFLIVFLFSFVGLPLYALWRRWNKHPKRSSMLPVLAVSISLLNLSYLAGLVVWIIIPVVTSYAGVSSYGIPLYAALLGLVPVASAILALTLALTSIRAWRQRERSRYSLSFYLTTALAGIFFLPYMMFWHVAGIL